MDIFSKGSAFSAKAACPFPPSGASATFPKEIFPEEKLPSLCMTKMSQSWNGLTKEVPKRQNSRRFSLLPDTKTEPMPSHRLCAYSKHICSNQKPTFLMNSTRFLPYSSMPRPLGCSLSRKYSGRCGTRVKPSTTVTLGYLPAIFFTLSQKRSSTAS